jgi:hypothetical protein
MEAAAKRRVGRPTTRKRERPGAYVGFRAPELLKNALEAAAVAAGNSLSTETQLLLRQALHARSTLPEALAMAYGETNAELLALFGEILRAADQIARTNETRGWYDHRPTLDLVAETIAEVFNRLRRQASQGEPVLDREITRPWVQQPLRELAGERGAQRRERLGAAGEPLVEWSKELQPGRRQSRKDSS